MALATSTIVVTPEFPSESDGYTYKGVIAQFTLDAAYPVGGEALDPALLGFDVISYVAVGASSSGRKFFYDYTNDKLVAQGSGLATADLGTPAVAATDAIHAAVTDDGTEQTITTAITDPDSTRVLTATSAGTAGDIGAIQVTVNGTNANDEVIQEVLPIFTADSATTVTGIEAFKTVTSIVIPAHDGTGATTAIGSGPTLGLPVELPRNTVVATYFGGVLETTVPTVLFSASAYEANTVLLDSTLDGSAVLVDYYLPEAAGDYSGEVVTCYVYGGNS